MFTSALRLFAVIGYATAFVWGADPVVGTWTLNVAKSKFIPGPAPKSQTRVYEAQGEGIKVTVRTVAADGHSTTVLISANYDGKDYPVTGSSDYDAIALKRINDQTAEAALTHAGKVVATSRREVSDDRRTMTITFQGQQISIKAVYDRQE